MHLEVRHLRLVAAIAAAGGVTRASDRLHLSQSALSHQLKDIESRLGTPLFLRVGRRMVITAAGERVLLAARCVLSEIQKAEADVTAEKAHGPAGLLRLAIEFYTSYHWLPGVLSAFRRQWPRVEVRIVLDATRRPLAALRAGEIDLAVVSCGIDEQPASAGRKLRFTPLFQDELVVIVPPNHPLGQRDHARPSDFAGEHVLLYTGSEGDCPLLLDVLRPAGVRPLSAARVELTDAIIELVKAGLGISVLSAWAAAPHVRAGTLASVPLTANGHRRQWSAACQVGADDDYLTSFISLLTRNAFRSALPDILESAVAIDGQSSKRRARSA